MSYVHMHMVKLLFIGVDSGFLWHFLIFALSVGLNHRNEKATSTVLVKTTRMVKEYYHPIQHEP